MRGANTKGKTMTTQVTISHNIHRILGDHYFRFAGSRAVIVAKDQRDSDGEQVFGVRVGREYLTLPASVLVL